jgi:hypothetical protein
MPSAHEVGSDFASRREAQRHGGARGHLGPIERRALKHAVHADNGRLRLLKLGFAVLDGGGGALGQMIIERGDLELGGFVERRAFDVRPCSLGIVERALISGFSLKTVKPNFCGEAPEKKQSPSQS